MSECEKQVHTKQKKKKVNYEVKENSAGTQR